MNRIRILWLIVVLSFVAGVSAQVPIDQADIRADQLLSGEADAELEAFGKRAAAEDLNILITAPQYWHDMIKEQIASGAGGESLQFQFRQTMVESVIVRLYSKPSTVATTDTESKPTPEPVAQAKRPAPPKPEVTIEPEADSRPQSQVGERPVAAQNSIEKPAQLDIKPVITPELESPAAATQQTQEEPAAEPASTNETAQLPTEDVANAEDELPEVAAPAETVVEEPAVSESMTPDPAPTTLPEPAVADEEELAQDTDISATENDGESAGDMETARASLEERINNGRPINKGLSIAQLRRGDQLFKTGPAIAVVRGSRVGRNAYWLEGDIDLEDEKISKVRAGKYEVQGRLSVVEEDSDEESGSSDESVVEESFPDERSEMEARYNDGRPIESTVSVEGLRVNDMIYVGDNLRVVIRRDKVSLKRYWLDGDLDMSREELEQRGNRKYRVARVIR